MVRGDHTRTSVVAGAMLLGLIVLAGCVASPADGDSAYPDLSLAETKSPVQLLRNETTSRIPTGAIEALGETADVSLACLSEDRDPEGLVRQWSSTAVVLVERASQWRTAKIGRDVVQSLVDEGWTARDAGGTATIHRTLLTSESSLAEIQVSSKEPDEGRASTSTDEEVTDYRIEIETHGPCVTTAGADSDEVVSLEKAK